MIVSTLSLTEIAGAAIVPTWLVVRDHEPIEHDKLPVPLETREAGSETSSKHEEPQK